VKWANSLERFPGSSQCEITTHDINDVASGFHTLHAIIHGTGASGKLQHGRKVRMAQKLIASRR
jgi:hypothetical protein